MERVSKETMRQYERIRRSGATNMFDYSNVIQIAKKLQFTALAKLTLGDYKVLLMNFGKLMKKYDIKQT